MLFITSARVIAPVALLLSLAAADFNPTTSCFTNGNRCFVWQDANQFSACPSGWEQACDDAPGSTSGCICQRQCSSAEARGCKCPIARSRCSHASTNTALQQECGEQMLTCDEPAKMPAPLCNGKVLFSIDPAETDNKFNRSGNCAQIFNYNDEAGTCTISRKYVTNCLGDLVDAAQSKGPFALDTVLARILCVKLHRKFNERKKVCNTY